MTAAEIRLPPKLVPVFTGEARYRGAYGGRGSGKTRTFAKMAAVRGYTLARAGKRGIIVCGREYMNSLDESSMAEVKAAVRDEPWLEAFYDIGEKFVRTKDGRIEFKFVGLRQNLDSIKSKAKIHLLWVDEAEPVSETAWLKAIPSVREEGSEIWVTWNPERKTSPTHKRFRLQAPAGSKIVEINFTDNPWFPAVLEGERLEDEDKRPEQYEHIWGGGFKSVTEGAYFSKQLLAARREGRICRLGADPLMSKRAYWDLGGSGADADNMAIWIAQFVGREIRVIDYIEGQGQVFGYYTSALRDRGHEGIQCILPHDGVNENNVTGLRYEGHLRQAGFPARVVKNQGKGAAMMRIEAARRWFPRMWFNEPLCEAGLEALAAYHEKLDEKREVGLGPNHDWSSHASDAFGLMAIDYKEPTGNASKRLTVPDFGAV